VYAAAPIALLLMAATTTFGMRSMAQRIPSDAPVIGRLIPGLPARSAEDPALVGERDQSSDRPLVGFEPMIDVQPAPPIEERVLATIEAIRLAILGPLAVKTVTVGGPLAIARVPVSQSAPNTFAAVFLPALAGSFWLPYLDGSRMLFLLIETAARRPLDPRYETWMYRAWLVIAIVIAARAFLFRS